MNVRELKCRITKLSNHNVELTLQNRFMAKLLESTYYDLLRITECVDPTHRSKELGTLESRLSKALIHIRESAPPTSLSEVRGV